MSQVPTTNALPPNWVQQAMQNPAAFLQTLDSLLENFGAEAIGNASAQRFLGQYGEGLKQMILNSDLPEGIKQMAIAVIDQHLADMGVTCPCSSEAADAVDNSEVAGEIDDTCQAALDETTGEAAEEASNEGDTAAPDSCGTTAAGDEATPAEGGAEAEAASGSEPVGEAEAEAQAEAENEGTGEAGGAGGAGGADPGREAADAALSAMMAETGESAERKKARGRNFLEILAESMGQTQAKFLNEALKHSKTMESLAGNSERADDFTIAQSKYTAAMQMFNIYSNQVATTLKTMGEALSAIARKQ